jgi:aminoglycoside/choline kinase family phosphotransferase
MIAPALGSEVARFSRIARWLQQNGFSAPELFAQTPDRGLLLLEDLGDDLIARLLAKSPPREAELYKEITEFLLALHRVEPLSGLPVLDGSTLGDMTNICGDWYVYAHDVDRRVNGIAEKISELYAFLTPPLYKICLRDFHAENLLWLPNRSGTARLGLLDFPDAVLAHPAYDLVSALQDARRDVSVEVEQIERRRYASAAGFEPDQFDAVYALLGAQRSIRILGIFTRLCLASGKAAYVSLIPRTWRYIERNLAHPALRDLAEPFFTQVPAPSDALLQRMIDQCGTHPMR